MHYRKQLQTLDEFERAIDASRSSISQSLLEMYRKYQERMSGVSVPIESK